MEQTPDPGEIAVNTFEASMRSKKAAALLAVLRAAGVSASVAREASADDWAIAAEAAKVNPPSPATVALVISRLEEMEGPEPECFCRQTDVDLVDSRDCPAHGDRARHGNNIGDTDAPPAEPEPCPF